MSARVATVIGVMVMQGVAMPTSFEPETIKWMFLQSGGELLFQTPTPKSAQGLDVW
jgi:hypothetical protein